MGLFNEKSLTLRLLNCKVSLLSPRIGIWPADLAVHYTVTNLGLLQVRIRNLWSTWNRGWRELSRTEKADLSPRGRSGTHNATSNRPNHFPKNPDSLWNSETLAKVTGPVSRESGVWIQIQTVWLRGLHQSQPTSGGGSSDIPQDGARSPGKGDYRQGERSPTLCPSTFTTFRLFQTLPVTLILERKRPFCQQSLSRPHNSQLHVDAENSMLSTPGQQGCGGAEAPGPQEHHQHPVPPSSWMPESGLWTQLCGWDRFFSLYKTEESIKEHRTEEKIGYLSYYVIYMVSKLQLYFALHINIYSSMTSHVFLTVGEVREPDWEQFKVLSLW